MICRMNKQQRELLIEMVRAMIIAETAPSYENRVYEVECQDRFHAAFSNETLAEDLTIEDLERVV